MNSRVDYHIHTYYSDGTLSPTDVVKWAKEKGLEVIAITDHDGVDGIAEGKIAGNALDMTVIPGIELSTETEDGKGLHILGYNINTENKELLNSCEDIRVKRKKRNEKLVEVLNEEGYSIDSSDLISRPGQDFIGKPIIARALVKKGYANSVAEAFDNILSKEKIRAIRKEKITVKKGISLIKEAGGIPVLAHPYLIKGIGARNTDDFYKKLSQLVEELKSYGLKGIECYYPAHSQEEILKFIEIAEKYHLHITTGSDYHGEEK